MEFFISLRWWWAFEIELIKISCSLSVKNTWWMKIKSISHSIAFWGFISKRSQYICNRFFYPFGVSDRQLPYGQYYKYNQKKFGIFRNKIDGGGGVLLPSCDQGPHKLKLKKKPSLKKGVSKTHSKMDDPSLELLISDMTVHI